MKRIDAKITENKRLAPDVYRMSVESAYLGRNSRPGQFVEVRCASGTEPLLRRAFCVHRITKRGISLLYQVVGRGTAILSRKKAGETLDLLGPLGNEFTINRPTGQPPARRSQSRLDTFKGEGGANRQTILVAGGVGVATLMALAEELRRKRRGVTVLLGDQTAAHIVCEKELKGIGCKVLVATEDGSKGHKGLVTDLLKKELANWPTACPPKPISTKHIQRRRRGQPSNHTTIYACGPDPMSMAVAKIASGYGIPCQLSLGDRMACGVGVCLGCPVKVLEFSSSRVLGLKPTNPRTHEPTNHIYKMACKDGPVFDAEEVVW